MLGVDDLWSSAIAEVGSLSQRVHPAASCAYRAVTKGAQLVLVAEERGQLTEEHADEFLRADGCAVGAPELVLHGVLEGAPYHRPA
jgi:hypothetical protein